MNAGALSDRDLAYVRTLVRRRSGNVLADGKEYLVQMRLSDLSRRVGTPVDELLREATRDPEGRAANDIVDALTINETSFFRDDRPFVALRDAVVPQLLERNAARRGLTIWSAACSSGQEIYSVAMLLQEHFAEQVAGWHVRLLASDVSPRMVERVHEGWYADHEVARGLTPDRRQRWFLRDGAGWRVRPELRALVDVREQNLLAPFSAIPLCDVVLLRNVLIYLDVPTKQDVLGRVHDVLRPDGVLFLGGAESTMHLDGRYARMADGGAVHYRRPAADLERCSVGVGAA